MSTHFASDYEQGIKDERERQLEQIEKRLEAAKQEGRHIEREYIDMVLGVCIDTALTQDQRSGLKLARDIIRGLPNGNV